MSIEQAINKVIEWSWNGINPSLGIKKFKEQSRDRFNSSPKINTSTRSYRKEENITAIDYFYISLLTGARKSNALSMKWNDKASITNLKNKPHKEQA